MDSKRLTILKRLTTFLSTEVTQANGYQYDLTDKVFRGRLLFDETNDPAPLVTIVEEAQLDSLQDVPNRRAGLDHAQWRLMIQGWGPTDRDNPSDPAYLLMADVQKALSKLFQEDYEGTPDFMLGKLCTGMIPSTGLVRLPEPTDKVPCFYLKLTIRFVENWADPYDLS